MNNAGLLLKSKHGGGDDSFAESVFASDITGLSDISSYSNVKIDSSGAHFLSSGYSGVTENIRNSDGTNISVSSSNSPRKIWTIKPSGFGALSSVTVTMTTGAYGSFTDQILLYCGGTLVAESDEYVKTDINTSQSEFTYTFDGFVLDPNKTYDLYFKTTYSTLRHISSATITATPLIYTSGWLISPVQHLSQGRRQVHLNVYTGGTACTVEYRLDGGSWNVADNYRTQAAASQTGAACTLRSYLFSITANADLELRIGLPDADSIVYGYSAAIL